MSLSQKYHPSRDRLVLAREEVDHANEEGPFYVTTRWVRTEDMGDTKTEDMGNTIEWADALEKRVTDGRKTEICEFGAERSLYGERAMQGVWDQPKERAQVA